MIAVDDFKYAIRLLSKRPGFTVLTTFVMAAGIGLSVYLFSFMNTMIFKPLPFKDGDSLVHISGSQNGARVNGELNFHDYSEIRNNLKGLSEFSAYKNIGVTVSGRDGARRYAAKLAEPNIFQLTRTKPLHGREFSDMDNLIGAPSVVVIGYDIWQNQFGGNPHILDETLRIDGVNTQIIGVMPQGYFFPNDAELWLPMRQDAAKVMRDSTESVHGLAHLNEGISLKDINGQITVIMQRIEKMYPKTNNGVGAYVDTIQKTLVGDGIAVVYSMLVAAILILVLASVNVGNLLLSRAVERGKETAIRMALGAPRSRLISQMLWESIIICSVGGTIGLLILAWGLDVTEGVIATFFVGKPSFWLDFGVDAFTLKLSLSFVLCTILITGLLPAWKNSGADFNAVLRDGTRGALGRKAGRLNRLLVISEIFLSIIVLIVASVIIVGCYNAVNVDIGAKTDNILTAKVQLSGSNYDSAEKQVQFVKTLQSRLEGSAGVGDVMIASILPGEFGNFSPAVAVEGREYTRDRGYPRANYTGVAIGSLAKLGVELKQGRYFTSADDGLDKRTVVVTESFVARNMADQFPLGKRIRIAEADSDDAAWLTIVGVVKHTVQGQPTEESGRTPSVFRPLSQEPRNQMTIAMQMRSDRAAATQTLRKVLQSIDPDLPAFTIDTYTDSIARNTAPLKFISAVFLLFGIVAVILAASGIFGVMSNTINQRTQEIGIKRALGAMEERITREFLMKGLSQLLWGGVPGLLFGGVMGFAMAKNMSIGNFGLLLIATTLMLIIGSVVMAATYIPTRRALLITPSQALRYE